VRNTRAVRHCHGPHGPSSNRSRLLCCAALTLALALTGCRPDGVHALPQGKVLYGSCDTCHGVNGEGKKEFGAPAIAGLPRWYVESALGKFRTGMRGAHPDDVEGLRMRPMSRQMMNEIEVQTVSKYVSELKPVAVPKTLEGGNAEAGKTTYATCAACHGPQGKGNEALKAPPIAGQHDWYLLTSLMKFKAGVRGNVSTDTAAVSMRPMAIALPDEQAMKNVVAYVGTLQ
jgi:cytochrome c553